MPLYSELPQGQGGVQALSSALTLTVMVVTVSVDSIVGIFAAGRWVRLLSCCTSPAGFSTDTDIHAGMGWRRGGMCLSWPGWVAKRTAPSTH